MTNDEEYSRWREWQRYEWEIEHQYKERSDSWTKEGLLIIIMKLGIYPRKKFNPVNPEPNNNQTGSCKV